MVYLIEDGEEPAQVPQQNFGGAADAERIRQLQDEIKSLQESLTQLRSQFQPKMWRLEDVLAASEKSKAEADALRATVIALKQELKDKDKELENKIDALEKKAAEAKEDEDAILDNLVTKDDLDKAFEKIPPPSGHVPIPFTISIDSSGDTDKVKMFLPPGSITYKSADVEIEGVDTETMLLDITDMMGEMLYCHVVDGDGVYAYVDNTPDVGEGEVYVFPVADLDELELSVTDLDELNDSILVHGSVIVPQGADGEINDGKLIFKTNDGEELFRFTANQADDTDVTVPDTWSGLPVVGNAPTALGDNQGIAAMRYDKDSTHSLQVKVRGLNIQNNHIVSVTPVSDWLTITNGTAVAHSSEV